MSRSMVKKFKFIRLQMAKKELERREKSFAEAEDRLRRAMSDYEYYQLSITLQKEEVEKLEAELRGG